MFVLPFLVPIFVVAYMALVVRGGARLFKHRTKELRNSWRSASMPNRAMVVAIFAGLACFAWINSVNRHAAHREMVRELFHLPPEATLTEFISRGRGRINSERIEAVVQFNEQDFEAYLQTLDDTAIWKPVAFTYHGERHEGSYAPNALVWRKDYPFLQGGRRIRWGHLQGKHRRGKAGSRFLCFAVPQPPVEDASPRPWSSVHDYGASACTEFPRAVNWRVYVRAWIDVEHRTMLVVIGG